MAINELLNRIRVGAPLNQEPIKPQDFGGGAGGGFGEGNDNRFIKDPEVGSGVWRPDPSTVPSGQTFTQTNSMTGATRQATGTQGGGEKPPIDKPPFGCPPGQHLENGICVDNPLDSPPDDDKPPQHRCPDGRMVDNPDDCEDDEGIEEKCPPGFHKDSSGRCVPDTPDAQGCPQGQHMENGICVDDAKPDPDRWCEKLGRMIPSSQWTVSGCKSADPTPNPDSIEVITGCHRGKYGDIPELLRVPAAGHRGQEEDLGHD